MPPDTLTPRDPRCEFLVTPLGVGEPCPRLSWKLESTERGAVPSASRVVVRADESSEAGWDTGWIAGHDRTSVAYAGPALRSDTRYHWEVGLRDAAGDDAGRARSWFETGVLSPAEWRAVWIARDTRTLPPIPVPQDHDRSLRCEYLPPPLQLRRTFTAGDVRRARVHVTARGVYRLRLNGVRVGRDELTPGWTDYAHRIQYQTYDVTDLLAEGDNVLGATVADGWWSGFVGMDARHQAQQYGTAPQFLAQLVLDRADGVREVIGTDGGWRERQGRIRYADLLMGQQDDARLDTPGWDRPGFDDSAWPFAVVAGTDTTTLTATGDEPVRVTAELPARSVVQRPEGFLVDLGQNIAGRVRLTVRGAVPGQRIRLRHGELLADDGSLYTENLRSAEATDIYYATGADEEVFEPEFTTHGFRYVEVAGYPGELRADDVTGVVLHSDTTFVGEFGCDDDLVTRLQANIRWGQRGNFVSVPTDCPQRDERLGWLADAQIFAPTACLNADCAAFFARWMRDVVSGQDAGGAFPDVAPKVCGCLDREGAPAWGDGGVLIPWHLYRTYGDRRVLDLSFGAMCAWVDHVHRHNPDLVWRHRRGNDYGDWLQVDAATPPEVLATAYFARSARTVSAAATALERPEITAHYARLAAEIGSAFVEEFVGDDGHVHGGTQTGQLLALAFGLLPDRLVDAVFGHLVRSVEERGNRLTTGFVGVALLCPTLAGHGRADLAHALLAQTAYPSWGYSVVNGATTIWERWDAWTADRGTQSAAMNSFNHYALGSVGEWLYTGVAGLDQAPGSVAWREAVVRPRVGGALTRASAEYDSVRGRFASRWQVDGDTFTLDVTVPPGAEATVYVPTADPDSVRESGDVLDDAPHVRGVERTGEEQVCHVGSGHYRFTASVRH
ncbi:MAG: Bacterial alpha-L-rhamnosidase [Streptosporangiales bacterium]|nr:Bacterial alpha-L-rhamnosidase [Streptosporangiales bacterium]